MESAECSQQIIHAHTNTQIPKTSLQRSRKPKKDAHTHTRSHTRVEHTSTQEAGGAARARALSGARRDPVLMLKWREFEFYGGGWCSSTTAGFCWPVASSGVLHDFDFYGFRLLRFLPLLAPPGDSFLLGFSSLGSQTSSQKKKGP